MPHSSGGGSHSGGSHSGGSSGSGGSGGASGPSGPRKSYYPGSRRYVYYRDYQPVYYYSATDPDSIIRSRRLTFIAATFFFFVFVMTMALEYSPPSRLGGYADTEIRITDSAGLLDDTDELYQALAKFQEETGITPMLYTTYNDAWDNYAGLGNFAYDLYVNTFEDESHWLLVYSTDQDNPGFDDWYWEGMQGDDTDAILSSDKLDVFNTTLQKYLTARSRYTIEEAFALSFSELTPTLMSADLSDLFFTVIIGLVYAFAWVCVLLSYRNARKKYAHAEKVPKTGKEIKCDYCGGIYVTGTVISCPHCGAPVPLSE